jgi:hypothetical protein
MEQNEVQQDQRKEDHGHSMVEITIDNKQYSIHRGHQTVAAIKTLAGIPLAYDLDQVIDGKFEPLPDEGGVTIKGGEIFIGHPKGGSSS